MTVKVDVSIMRIDIESDWNMIHKGYRKTNTNEICMGLKGLDFLVRLTLHTFFIQMISLELILHINPCIMPTRGPYGPKPWRRNEN
jgi:hypothetical protein